MSDQPSKRIAVLWGLNLRKRRSDDGHTQTGLAELVGLSQETVSRYERGVAPWTPEMMLTFAVALDTRVADLFPWPTGIEDAEKFRLLTAPKASVA